MPDVESKPQAKEPEKKKKKKQTVASIQKDLRDLSRPEPGKAQKPAFDLKKVIIRVGLILAVVWGVAIAITAGTRSFIPEIVVGVVTLVIAGAGIWVWRFTRKTQSLGALLQGADTEEGRKEALAQARDRLQEGGHPGDPRARPAGDAGGPEEGARRRWSPSTSRSSSGRWPIRCAPCAR